MRCNSAYLTLFGACVLILAACASQPKEIKAHKFSASIYTDLNCSEINSEMNRVARKSGELYSGLKKTADDDAAQMGVGLVVFWPTLFLLEGGDGQEAGQFAQLKGEFEALRQAAIINDCGERLANLTNEYIPNEVGLKIVDD